MVENKCVIGGASVTIVWCNEGEYFNLFVVGKKMQVVITGVQVEIVFSFLIRQLLPAPHHCTQFHSKRRKCPYFLIFCIVDFLIRNGLLIFFLNFYFWNTKSSSGSTFLECIIFNSRFSFLK